MTPAISPPSASESHAGNFASTHWTVVLEAARQDSPTGQAALGALYEAYRGPIYAFIRRTGRSPEDAEDLTHDFFARLVEKNWLGAITREGGRFRSVLVTAVKHFLSHARDHDRALKRGGGLPLFSLHASTETACDLAAPVNETTPEHEFERRWALGILQGAMTRLQREYERLEKADLFDELKGFLTAGSRPVAHAEIAARHDISVNAVGVAIHRLRRRYGELLREQVAHTVNDPREVDEELRHLVGILAR